MGLTGPAAPGSFIAFMGVTAKGDYPGVILGIAVSAAVSFFVAGALFGFGRNSDDEAGLTDIELTKAEEVGRGHQGASDNVGRLRARRQPQRATGGLTRAEHRGQ